MAEPEHGPSPLAAGLERLLASEFALGARTRLVRWQLPAGDRAADVIHILRGEERRCDRACESLVGALKGLGRTPRRSLDDLLKLSSVRTVLPPVCGSAADLFEDLALQHETLASDTGVLVFIIRPEEGPPGARRIVLRLKSVHEEAAEDWRRRADDARSGAAGCHG